MIHQVKNKKRPFGVTLFAVIYSWIGWFGSIALLVMAVTGELPDVQRTFISAFTEPGVFIRLGAWIAVGIWWLLYVTYGFLGFGLWKLREWSRRAVIAISLSFAALSVATLPFFVRPMILLLPVITGTILFVGWQVWYLTRPEVRYAFSDSPLTQAALGGVAAPPLTRTSGSRKLRIAGSAVAAMALFMATVIFAVEISIEHSVPYKMSLQEAAHSQCVASKIGSSPAPGWNTSGNLEETGDEGKAELSIPVRGSKGRGSLNLVAEEHAGSWEIKSLMLDSGSTESSIVPAGPCE